MSAALKQIKKKMVLVPKLRFKGFKKGLEILKLDELVTFTSGGTPSKDNPIFWDGDIPWISAASMNGKYYSTSDRKITKIGLENGSKLAPKRSLLLLVRGSMLFNKVPIGIAAIDVAFNQDLKALITKENTISEFLYQWFYSKQNLLLDKVVITGIGAGKLDTEDLKKLNIHLPTLPEQQKIASFLSAIDEKIQQLTRKKELLEQYKKGVIQQLFSGKLRFRDQNGKPFIKWKEKCLEDICTFFSGGTPSSTNKDFYSGNIPFIGSGNIYDSEISNFITEEAFNSSSAKIVTKGDLLYALYGANSGEVAISKIKGAINQAILCIRSKENIKYLYYVLWLNKDKIVAKYLQGGQGNLSANIIRGLKYKFPSIPEQQKIANYLSHTDTKIETITKQISQIQTFKKGLLQQMFV